MGRQALLSNLSIRNSLFNHINIIVDDRFAIKNDKGEEYGAGVEIDTHGDAPIRMDSIRSEIIDINNPAAEVESIREFIQEQVDEIRSK